MLVSILEILHETEALFSRQVYLLQFIVFSSSIGLLGRLYVQASLKKKYVYIKPSYGFPNSMFIWMAYSQNRFLQNE